MNFKIDRSKAINTLLYIVEYLNNDNSSADIHKVMKLMYFADREHLVNYGFPITGDTYQKLPYGPVPSFSNNVANDNIDEVRGIISRNGYCLTAHKSPDLEDLSESEIECINISINTYKDFSFKELTNLSHDYAWNTSDWDISYFKIAEEMGVNEDMKAFIKEQILNDNISFI